MAQKAIKVGFCVAYDWRLLKNAIPPIYERAEVICLSLDKERKSWGGSHYEFDEEGFQKMISKIDRENKIMILEGNYSSTDLNSRQNCNFQRNDMANFMGKGGWHIQIDSDEYFINFNGFVDYLKKIHPCPSGDEKGLNVQVNLIPIYKQKDDAYFIVDFKSRLPESAPFATNRPDYKRARNSDHFNNLSPYFAFHETWARGKEELEYKIANWGHAAEELSEQSERDLMVKKWEALDETNYHTYKNFHPASPKAWPALKLLKANSIEDLIHKNSEVKLPISPLMLWLRNQRLIGKIRQITSF